MTWVDDEEAKGLWKDVKSILTFVASSEVNAQNVSEVKEEAIIKAQGVSEPLEEVAAKEDSKTLGEAGSYPLAAVGRIVKQTLPGIRLSMEAKAKINAIITMETRRLARHAHTRSTTKTLLERDVESALKSYRLEPVASLLEEPIEQARRDFERLSNTIGNIKREGRV